MKPKISKWEGYSDAKLLLMYRESENQEILAVLFTRYTETLFGICMKYLKNVHDASDMVQEVYIRVVKYLVTNEVKNFRGWIGVVTRNACLNAQGKNSKDIYMEQSSESEKIAIDTGLNELLENENNFERVGNCLGSLNPEQRRVINLFYFEEYCYKDIAKMIDAEWKTVRTLLQNARRNLRICMENSNGSIA